MVKDYNGSNYFDTEYIDGIPYKTILFPEIRQIWLASNYAKKEGFIPADGDQDGAEVAEVNNGEIIEKRKAVFLNEWNGCYWEKKQLNEGDTVVVENTCFDVNNGEKTTNVCWVDTEDVEPMVYPFEASTTFLREDEVGHVLDQSDVLKNVKKERAGHILVPKVVK